MAASRPSKEELIDQLIIYIQFAKTGTSIDLDELRSLKQQFLQAGLPTTQFERLNKFSKEAIPLLSDQKALQNFLNNNKQSLDNMAKSLETYKSNLKSPAAKAGVFGHESTASEDIRDEHRKEKKSSPGKPV